MCCAPSLGPVALSVLGASVAASVGRVAEVPGFAGMDERVGWSEAVGAAASYAACGYSRLPLGACAVMGAVVAALLPRTSGTFTFASVRRAACCRGEGRATRLGAYPHG